MAYRNTSPYKVIVDNVSLVDYNVKASKIDEGGVIVSICPKNKTSRGRRDKRRANWKMEVPSLVKCSKCGALMMPHRVCKACGSYNKREIVSAD